MDVRAISCSLLDMNGSMASASATSSSLVVSAPSACPSSKKTAAAIFRRRRTVSCRATRGGGRGDNDGLLWLPRRDVMLNGLTGVAAGLAWNPASVASGTPASQCSQGADKVKDDVLLCTNDTTNGQKPCPVVLESASIDDFKRPVTRVRQPVHLLSQEYQEKYKEAVWRMKKLPESDPLSFAAQAAIHQAYCDSYYKYHKSSSGSETKDLPFDVHFLWIFAPWHRMYIYFYERALGQLIGDDTFALPYWNWDAPAGMVVPPLFRDTSKWKNPDGEMDDNPLYDLYRNANNLDKVMDLNYLSNKRKGKETIIPFEGREKDEKYSDFENNNLCTLYIQQQVDAIDMDAVGFLGEKYCTDIKGNSSQGTLEQMAHTAVHVWVGRAGSTPCNASSGGVLDHKMTAKQADESAVYSCLNDMGFLGSASKDPLFYSHHSNVDRMWHLWSTRLGGGQGITDPDWLDASFVFYDVGDHVNSPPRKVRMKISDVLDTRDLGYTYAAVSNKDLPWLKPKRTSLVPAQNKDSSAARSLIKKSLLILNDDLTNKQFPLDLVQNQAVEVPAVDVPAKEAGKAQLLVIEGIEFDPQANNKFDVAINVPVDKALQVGPQYKEYAGSFAVVPGSGSGAGGTRKGKLSLCISNVLADMNIKAGGGSVDVVIVPRTEAKVKLNVRPTIQNRE